jgi:hypothetical protein
VGRQAAGSYDVVADTDVDDQQLLDCMNAAFGRDRPLDWFRWKHREGPWGPSRGWAVLDAGAVVGVRLVLPWEVAGRPLGRMIDGAVLASHRRRGIFRDLTLRCLQRWDLPLVSTAVRASAASYEALGWQVRQWPASLGLPRQDLPVWSEAQAAWRTDPRSGHEYRFRGGLTYRVAGRALVPLFGSRREILRVAAKERVVPVRLGAGPVKASGPTVASWPSEPAGMTWADLEAVI